MSPLWQPQNGWDGKIQLAEAGDTVFQDASELYQIDFEENYNLARRRQLGTRSPGFMPGQYEASGKANGYFISGVMASKIYGVPNNTDMRDHAARGPALFNVRIDFSTFPIVVKQGALVVWPNATPTTATAATGGSLVAATYSYRVTALIAGVETAVSPAVAQVVPPGTATNTVTVNWTAVAGATGYKVYGRTAGTELLIATLGNVLTFTDTGDIVPAGVQPVAAAEVKLTGYLLAGCYLNTDNYSLQDSTYVEKTLPLMIQRVYDVYDTDTDANLLPLLV